MENNEFKSYKEKQNYYKERYANRGTTLHISKIIGNDNKVIQSGNTYEKRGVFRKLSK